MWKPGCDSLLSLWDAEVGLRASGLSVLLTTEASFWPWYNLLGHLLLLLRIEEDCSLGTTLELVTDYSWRNTGNKNIPSLHQLLSSPSDIIAQYPNKLSLYF